MNSASAQPVSPIQLSDRPASAAPLMIAADSVGARLDDDGVGLEVGDLLGLRAVGRLRGLDVEAREDVEAQEAGGLLGGVGRELEAFDLGGEDRRCSWR